MVCVCVYLYGIDGVCHGVCRGRGYGMYSYESHWCGEAVNTNTITQEPTWPQTHTGTAHLHTRRGSHIRQTHTGTAHYHTGANMGTDTHYHTGANMATDSHWKDR